MSNPEPLLDPANDRMVIHPILYPKTYKWYQTHGETFWLAHEITKDFPQDREDFKKLSEGEQHVVKMILAFFATSDALVSVNLVLNFCDEVAIPEAKAFYGIQNLIEIVHNDAYSRLIENLISDPIERDKVVKASTKMPIIAKMTNWIVKWTDARNLFVERIVAFAVIEGIFFSGPFAYIFWLRDRGILPAFGKANEFISRDEGYHRDFACHLYKDLIVGKLSDKRIYEIVKEGTDIALEFVCESLPCSLLGMNQDMMIKHVKYVADHLINALGHPSFYGVKESPFKETQISGMEIKSNFFEDTPTVYKIAKADEQIDFNDF